LSKKSPSLKLLQQLRNEAHRFAIEFHRDQRSKATLHNDWEDIPGIGPKTLDKLWQHFSSPKVIQTSSLDKLTAVIGSAKAKLLLDYFLSKKITQPIELPKNI
jgi:excinuclease ABC subunit C